MHLLAKLFHQGELPDVSIKTFTTSFSSNNGLLKSNNASVEVDLRHIPTDTIRVLSSSFLSHSTGTIHSSTKLNMESVCWNVCYVKL